MKQSEIGWKIRDARNSLGYTQSQLAEKCRLDIRTIQRIESGRVIPRFYTLNLISEVLGTEFGFSSFKKGVTGTNVNPIRWEKNILSTSYFIKSNDKTVGNLFNRTFSQSASGELNGEIYTFRTFGFLEQKTRILNADNQVVGVIEYNTWKTNARLIINNEEFYWRYDNLWYNKWSLYNSEGIHIQYKSSATGGSIESNTANELLLLSGLFVTNFYWQMIIVLIIASFIPIWATILR